MKKVLVLLYGLCVLAVGIWFTACDMPNHNDEVYPMLITDKWEDTGFFGKTKYHISYKVQNGDSSWHYYADRSVPGDVYRRYEVNKTYKRYYDDSSGFMAFCTDGDLGIDTKKK